MNRELPKPPVSSEPDLGEETTYEQTYKVVEEILRKKYVGKLFLNKETKQTILVVDITVTPMVEPEEIWLKLLNKDKIITKRWQFGSISLINFLNERMNELQRKKNEDEKSGFENA